MPLEGFEPTIQASERPQTRTLGRAATGIALLYSLRFRTICPPQPRGVILAASNTVRVAHFLYPTRCRVDPFSYFVPNTGYPNRYLWNVLSPWIKIGYSAHMRPLSLPFSPFPILASIWRCRQNYWSREIDNHDVIRRYLMICINMHHRPIIKYFKVLEGCLTVHFRTATCAPHTRPTQWLSRPPPIQKLGAENHMLQLNI